jgi:hypothetical protein
VTTEMGPQPPTFIDWLLTPPYFFAFFFCAVGHWHVGMFHHRVDKWLESYFK